jgi:hypothetical protein
MLRRTFASFDLSERRRLLDELREQPAASPGAGAFDPAPAAASDYAPGFAAALPLLLTILGLEGGEQHR